LCETGRASALSSALVWAERAGAERLTIFVDEDADVLARFASYFTLDGASIEVRQVAGARSEAVEPAPVPERYAEPGGTDELVAELRGAGAEVVVEHGVVRGEVLGLEVARLVVWPTEHGGDGALHLEAGVGRFDRDAVAAAHPDEAPRASLDRTVAAVRARRYPGAPTHPVQLLARSRWLRADLISDPAAVGASALHAIGMTTEPHGLRDEHPAAALGTDAAGDPLLVVCSSGVDLSLVPLAADTRACIGPDTRLVLALPERDHHRATRTLVGLLRSPAELVAVPEGWG
ncbi:MAG: hypothetical protein ACYC2O_05305, partial [Microthrixaceae bacterium]